MTPLISYYVVAYNAEKWIAETITSIYVQGITDFEIVIVDDASTDGTANAVGPFLKDSRIRYSRFSRNRGVGASFPAALLQCRGEFFCAVDGDDALEPCHTNMCLDLFSKYPEAAIVATRLLAVDEHGTACQEMENAALTPSFPEYLGGNEALLASLQHNIVAGPGSMTRACITKEILPLFRAGWRFSNDWIFWMLHFATGFGFASSTVKSVRYRVHKKSLSRRPDLDAVRGAEIRLSPIAGLRFSMPHSREAAVLWQNYARPLYSLWLLRAAKWYLRGLLPMDYIHLARSLYYSGKPNTMPFLGEVLLHLPSIVAACLREYCCSKRQHFPCCGMRQVDHPIFRSNPHSL